MILRAIFLFFVSLTLVSSVEAGLPNGKSILDYARGGSAKKNKPKSSNRLMLTHPEYANTETLDKKTRFPGMFSVFNTVVGCLDLIEKNEYQSFVLDFEDKGLYYEPSRGLNWWSYYCEPIFIQGANKKYKTKLVDSRMCWMLSFQVECFFSREKVFEIISRYIKFKPSVLDIVESFETAHFQDKFVVGVHYRGTDKIGEEGQSEACVVPYLSVSESIRSYLEDNNLSDYLLFVASDESRFIEYMEEAFPGRVVCTDAERSSSHLSLHHHTENPYQHGLETVVDCLLLSRVDALFRTSSNLSLWSSYLNPKLPVFDLSQRYSVNLNW